jgi:predicted RecA/RadA family phage recombinase
MKTNSIVMIAAACLIGAAYMATAGQATYVQSGQVVDYTATADVSAGAVVVQGYMVGVANSAIASNELGSLTVQGVFDVVQKAEAITNGVAVYWDATGNPYGGTAGTGAATRSPSGATFMGFALKTTTAVDATVRIALRSTDASNTGYIVATNEIVRATAAEAAAIITATNAAISFFVTPGATVTQALPGITNVYSAKGVLISHNP